MDQSMNKMGTVPIGKIMLTMGAPMIFSLVLQAFYNTIDSYLGSAMPDTAEITTIEDTA